MKKILLLTLLSLFGASLNAMRDMTVEERQFFGEAFIWDVKVETFADYVVLNVIDIDTVKWGYRDESVGQYLAQALRNAKSTGDSDVGHRIEVLFYPRVQQYRSNPPEAPELRLFILDALLDGAKIADLERFLQVHCLNIDLIRLSQNFDNTLGSDLDYNKISHDKATALNALAISRLNRVQAFRTHKSNLLEELLIEARFDVSRFDAFKAEYEKSPVNVDVVAMASGNSFGEYLSNSLTRMTDYSAVLKIAELVQPHRTNKYEIYGELIGIYVKDEKRFGDLQAWFEKFPCDFDVATIPGRGSFGKALDELMANPTTDDAMRKKVLRVLELGRPHRANDMKVFRELFKKYEQDSSKFVDLKRWFDEHLFDIDKVAYDAAKPQGETVGQRINWLNDANITTLFKAHRSTPDVPHAHSWFTPKKILCAALVCGAGYYYYRKSGQKNEEENKDVLSMPLVS